MAMNAVPPSPPPVSRPPPADASAAMHAAVQRVVDRAYRDLAENAARDDLLRVLCQGLAQALGLRLLALVRRHEGGTLEVEAASRETALWAELVRLPERWDGTIAGNGPAARALREGVPLSISAHDEGFMPWREAARRDGIAQLCACPLQTDDGAWVLLACADLARRQTCDAHGEIAFAAAACTRLLNACERAARAQLLAAALRHSGHAAFIADTEGSIVWCNPALCELTGYARDEIIGQNPRLLSSGRHGVRHYRELWNTIRGGQVWRGETVDRDRHGGTFIARQTVSPFGVGERITHYLAQYDDITREKHEDAQRELHAGHDPLTGLLHRAAFERALAEALARGEAVRVALVAARDASVLEARGDAALETYRGELQARVRHVAGPDRATRHAPGEFLVRLPDEADAAQRMIDTLRRELAEPYPLIGAVNDVDLAIGQVHAPRDGTDVDALLRAAEAAVGTAPGAPARRGMVRG